ncbi:MAG: hypothetical protein K9M11_04140 [Candidatus Pacebacteria bacterium]|nr:hypothetical protein [Candidatus Paceibacterota bacterium]
MKISLIASLYKTDKQIKSWCKWLTKFTNKLSQAGVDFEVIIIANEPNTYEQSVLNTVKDFSWVRYYEVPRETIYASWNRGIRCSTGEVYGFINVDDVRFVTGIVDGIQRIQKGADFVYFPFIYKRYIRIFNFLILVKRKMFTPETPEVAVKIKGMPYGPFWLVSSKFIDKVGSFDESFKVAGDYEWSMRTKTKGIYELSDVVSGIFTSDGKTLSGSKSPIHAQENERIGNMYSEAEPTKA